MTFSFVEVVGGVWHHDDTEGDDDISDDKHQSSGHAALIREHPLTLP